MVVGRNASDHVSTGTELQVHWIRELAQRLGLNDGDLRMMISVRLHRSAGPDLGSFLATALSYGEAARLYRHLLKLSRQREVVDRLRQGIKE